MDWSVGGEDSKVAAARQQQQCGVISVHAARSGFAKKCGRGRVAAVALSSGVAAAASSSVVHERGSGSASHHVVVRKGCAAGCRS